MKLSEQLRSEVELNRRHSPAYSKGLDDCAAQVEAMENRLEAIIKEANATIKQKAAPLRDFEHISRMLLDAVVDLEKKVLDVARGKE